MRRALFILPAVVVAACDPGKPEVNETCDDQFTETTCIDLVGGSSAILEFDSFSPNTYCAEFRQMEAKPNRITSGRLFLDSTTELMSPNDFNQQVLSVARIFEVDAGHHQLRYESKATKNASAKLCLYSHSACYPIEDLPEPDDYDAVANLAVSQLSSEGLLEASEDPLTLIIDRMAALLNICPDELLAHGDADIFRHYSEESHLECDQISPQGAYVEGAQYCGLGACAPGTITTPRFMHYVNECINEDCQSHDVCYEAISPGKGCYWSKYTVWCDLTLATSIQFCNVPENQENDTKAQRKEKVSSRMAKAAVAVGAAAAATLDCCALAPPVQIGSACAAEPLEGQPNVHYCISFSTDVGGDDIIMTMTRSDQSPFGSWYVAIDLELNIAGEHKTLKGSCDVYDGYTSITQMFGAETIGEDLTATATARVRVAPDYESCKSQSALTVSTATLECEEI